MKTLLAVILALALLPVNGICSNTGPAPAYHPDSQSVSQPSRQNGSNVAATIGVSLLLTAALGYAWQKWGGSKAVRSERRQKAYLKALKEAV